MNTISARYLAIDILSNLYTKQLPVRILFDKAVRRHDLPNKERNLTMHLIYGVLRNRENLDRMLSLLSKTPLKKLDPFVHQALAVGLYQLFYMDRIPQSAAVNEVVKSCKAASLPKRLHGFVNAILREAIRQQQELPEAALLDEKGSPLLNHPHWLTKRWQEAFGQEETQRICTSNNLEPALILQTNSARTERQALSKKLAAAGIAATTSPYSDNGIVVNDFHGPISTLPGYDEGLFYVQNDAAQLAGQLLGPFKPGARYLDGCAGLGGKTASLVQELKRAQGAYPTQAQITGVEPDQRRLNGFKENMGRLFGKKQPGTYQGTLQEFCQEAPGLFEGILIDAPCSGTGVVGRQPDIRWHRKPGDLSNYQQQQIQLLNHAATLSATGGGVLVYATCSLEPEENQQVIDIFLQDHPRFQLSDCHPYLPKATHCFIRDNCFCPTPHQEIDGFFAARLIND